MDTRYTRYARYTRYTLATHPFQVWLVHLFANRFLDSDLAFLHYQEKEVRHRPVTRP